MTDRSERQVDPALRKTLAKNLRTARLASQLTQKQLADLAGISSDYVGQIEHADANVSMDVLALLARFLETTIVKLLTP